MFIESPTPSDVMGGHGVGEGAVAVEDEGGEFALWDGWGPRHGFRRTLVPRGRPGKDSGVGRTVGRRDWLRAKEAERCHVHFWRALCVFGSGLGSREGGMRRRQSRVIRSRRAEVFYEFGKPSAKFWCK